MTEQTQPQEGQPMTAQTETGAALVPFEPEPIDAELVHDSDEPHVPFPTDPTTGMPIPPAPTREEEAERIERAQEAARRQEEIIAAERDKRHNATIEEAKKTLARLIAMDADREAEIAEAARTGVPVKPRRVFDHDYVIADGLDEVQLAAARQRWESDLDALRDELEDDDEDVTSWRIEHIEDAAHRDLVKRFVDQIRGGKKKRLIIYGSVGAGKTVVGTAAGYYALDLGIRPRFVSHATYLERLRPEASRPNGMTRDQYRQSIGSAPLLVWDDFCAGMKVDASASEFVIRETQMLLDERAKPGRATIVTTNVTTDQVRTIMDDRIASRLGKAAVVIGMKGRDRREPATW